MASRRKAREFALQLLFQEDVAGTPIEEIAEFWGSHRTDWETREFAEKLFRVYVDNRESVDETIRRHTRNWRLDRMAVVDRNILRMAVAEFFAGDTPAVVVIDEAIEVARKFSTRDSSEFVNGVLDSIRKEIQGDTEEENDD